jgi:hypothetical protein
LLPTACPPICGLEKQASATHNLVELAEKLEIVQSEKVARKLGGDWTAAIAAHY